MQYYQTGDILYFKEPKLPKGLKTEKTGIVLRSPVTGHTHAVKNGKILKSKEGVMFISVPKKATLTHPEHKDLALPKGEYRIQIVNEYDHLAEEARKVID